MRSISLADGSNARVQIALVILAPALIVDGLIQIVTGKPVARR
jgi:hypothetical protein